jgi:hypothetical protein
MKADKDEDAHISEKELDEVMLRLKMFAGRRGNKGPKFDDEAIRAAFKNVMTNQGASLARIHSAIRKEQQQYQQEQQAQQQVVDDEEQQLQHESYEPVAYSFQEEGREIGRTQSQPIVIEDLNPTGSEEATRQAGVCC